jgi:hypothetical protein
MKVPVAPAVFGYREAPSLPDLVEIINFARFFSVVIREVRAAFRYNPPPRPGSAGDRILWTGSGLLSSATMCG